MTTPTSSCCSRADCSEELYQLGGAKSSFDSSSVLRRGCALAGCFFVASASASRFQLLDAAANPLQRDARVRGNVKDGDLASAGVVHGMCTISWLRCGRYGDIWSILCRQFARSCPQSCIRFLIRGSVSCRAHLSESQNVPAHVSLFFVKVFVCLFILVATSRSRHSKSVQCTVRL